MNLPRQSAGVVRTDIVGLGFRSGLVKGWFYDRGVTASRCPEGQCTECTDKSGECERQCCMGQHFEWVPCHPSQCLRPPIEDKKKCFLICPP